MKKGTIQFIDDGEIIIEISDGKFFFKGEELKDVYRVYQRFNEWLELADKSLKGLEPFKDAL